MRMKKIAFAVHGGASNNTSFLKKHSLETEQALAYATRLGYGILNRGGSALDAVEKAVNYLEDSPLFNAGRGSVLRSDGMVTMDASMMNGKNLKAGAVAQIQGVKNPISLARLVMNKTKHVFLCGNGALDLARQEGLVFEPEAYFIIEHQQKAFQQAKKTSHGTVGAVALDRRGNLAAGTSTGGTNHCLPGRIGDSCIVGAGCYANNQRCAVSGTGEGEYLITGVIAHSIAMMSEFHRPIQEACDYVLFTLNKNITADIGVIALSPNGDVGIAFNSQIMKRAWMSSSDDLQVKIHR